MPSKSSKGGYYAVKKGRTLGVFNTWAECEAQTKGFAGSIYKKFPTLAEAEQFVGDSPEAPPAPSTSAVSSSETVKVVKLKPTADPKGKKRAFDAEVEDTTGWDIVYSDGACKGNGKVGSFAGVGVWWGPNDKRNIAERCPGDQTNNRAELIAILRVLETTPMTKKPLLIRTDSQYSINCFRNWIHKWKREKWVTSQGLDVKNAGIIRCISLNLDIRGRLGQKVVLEYVKGHSGDTGNDGADLMANQGAVLPIQPERNWDVLERELGQQLAEMNFHGEPIATSEVLGGPFNDLPESQAEHPKKVRKTSSQKAVTSTFQRTIKTTTQTISSPSPDPDSKSRQIVVHSSSQETTIIRKSGQSATSSTTQISKTSSYSHIWNEPDKVPLKVVYVAPSLLADNKEEIDLSMYADCLLPDGDLADELSDP